MQSLYSTSSTRDILTALLILHAHRMPARQLKLVRLALKALEDDLEDAYFKGVNAGLHASDFTTKGSRLAIPHEALWTTSSS